MDRLTGTQLTYPATVCWRAAHNAHVAQCVPVRSHSPQAPKDLTSCTDWFA